MSEEPTPAVETVVTPTPEAPCADGTCTPDVEEPATKGEESVPAIPAE